MIKQVFQNIFLSLGIGFLIELICNWLKTDYLHTFFTQNLITLLVALLAINATTMGIVLTKIRDFIDKNGGSECFKDTRQQMMLSVKEQIGLIVFGTFLLTISKSPSICIAENLCLLINSSLNAIFVYSLLVLFDTAKGVLIIIDFEG